MEQNQHTFKSIYNHLKISKTTYYEQREIIHGKLMFYQSNLDIMISHDYDNMVLCIYALMKISESKGF